MASTYRRRSATRSKKNWWDGVFWFSIGVCLTSFFLSLLMIANPTLGNNTINKIKLLRKAKIHTSKADKLEKISKLADSQNKANKVIESLRASKYKVKSHYANVRSGPGKTYEIRQVLHKNHKIEVLEARGKWLKIGKDSWISRLTLSPY